MAGFAAGAVLGILFAPEKGSRIRRSIVRKGEDVADEIGDKIEERFDELIDKVRSLRKSKKYDSARTEADVTS
jgi:gas vesicle protein